MKPNPSNPIVILIAEDDAEDRMFVRKALDSSRLINAIHFVEDGEELMNYLHNIDKYADKGKYPHPGLILLDLNMPRKDGREALKEIKSDPSLACIPVIALTTSKAEEDILRSYKLGVNSYITKPVTFEALVEVMKTISLYWLEIVELPRNC